MSDVLTRVIDEHGNPSQGHNLQKAAFEASIFKKIQRIWMKVTGNHKIPRVSDISDSAEIGSGIYPSFLKFFSVFHLFQES